MSACAPSLSIVAKAVSNSFDARAKESKRDVERPRCGFYLGHLECLEREVGGVSKGGDACEIWNDVFEQFDLFADKDSGHGGRTRDIAAGVRK